MLTLDEAVAKLDAELSEPYEYSRCCEEHGVDTCVDWKPKAAAIRAAVRDVARAAWYATVAPPSNSLSMAAVAESIDRLFGDK